MAQVGDIFSIPLGDGRTAIGQVFEKGSSEGLAVILVFDYIFAELDMPTVGQLHKCIASKPVILASSFSILVDKGDWKTLANISPVLDRKHLPAFRVAGLPFGLVLESYDRQHKRLARIREINAAPNNYSISPKWLEDAVRAYFKVKDVKWESRFDKLLFKNVVPFGK